VRRSLHHGTAVKYSYGSVYRGEEVEGEGRESEGQIMRVCGVESSSFDILAVYTDVRGNWLCISNLIEVEVKHEMSL
jgi:hypothetical protein